MTDVRAHMRQAPDFVEFEQGVQAAELEKDNPRRVERKQPAIKTNFRWEDHPYGHFIHHRIGSPK